MGNVLALRQAIWNFIKEAAFESWKVNENLLGKSEGVTSSDKSLILLLPIPNLNVQGNMAMLSLAVSI